MFNFVNTIDLLGDDATAKAFISRSITEYRDDSLSYVDNSTFRSCKSLKLLDLPNLPAFYLRP